MNAIYGGLFLAVGILFGVLAIFFGIGRRSGILWMTVELVSSSIAGSCILHGVATQLPGGWFAFVYTGVAFAVINQVPRWYFSGEQGLEALELSESFPPILLFALIMAFASWHTALWAASAFFNAPGPIEFPGEAALLTVVTILSVSASLLAGIIEV